MEELLSYSLRIAPGLVLITLLFFIIPGKQVLARIFVLILGFILMRDAMTPEGLWNFGTEGVAMWLRFIDNPFILTTLGVVSLLVAIGLLRVKQLKRLVRWGDWQNWHVYAHGFVWGALVAAPFLLISASVPVELRGGEVALGLLPALALMAFFGNFLEEVVFRGFLQSHLEKKVSSVRAALISGLTFAAAHIFLATTVTALGGILLIFVTLEGLVCAFMYKKYGLISAAVAHGTAIFLLAAGLL